MRDDVDVSRGNGNAPKDPRVEGPSQPGGRNGGVARGEGESGHPTTSGASRHHFGGSRSVGGSRNYDGSYGVAPAGSHEFSRTTRGFGAEERRGGGGPLLGSGARGGARGGRVAAAADSIDLLESDDEDVAEAPAQMSQEHRGGGKAWSPLGNNPSNPGARAADEVEFVGTGGGKGAGRSQRKSAREAEMNIAGVVAFEKGGDPKNAMVGLLQVVECS